MKQNQDKLSKLRNDFTLKAPKIAEILGISISLVNCKMSNRKYYKFTDDEIEKLKDYLVAEAEELKKSRE